MGTKGICILVVNDDVTCKNIVSEMLQHCNYQVLHIGGVLDVLNAIWEAKDTLDIVLTNAHKLESDGSVIVQHIQKKLNLPIILMCSDTKKIVSKGQQLSYGAYDLKGLSRNDVNNLWQFALDKEKAKMVATFEEEEEQEEEGNVKKSSMSNIVAVETNKTSSPIDEAVQFSKKRKINEKDEDNEDEPPVEKKPRVVWTSEMHQKFLEAIELLGYEKAVPKKIVEVMSIPGLSRENVASHLQKFRGGMKRAQETVLSSLSGSTVRNEFKPFCKLPSTSPSSLDSWHTDLITPNLPRNSYTSSSAKLCLSTSNSLYLDGHDYRLKGKNYTYRIGVNNLQHKYVPKLQLARNFRIYGDRMRNALLSVGQSGSSPEGNSNNQSGISKFVGYRLASDGNSIDFGQKIETSDNAYIADDAVLFKNISENSSILPCDQEFSNLQSMNGISAHNASIETSDNANIADDAVLFKNISENPSILPCDQDFSNLQSTNDISARNASTETSDNANIADDAVLFKNISENPSILPCDQDFSNLQSTNDISARNASTETSDNATIADDAVLFKNIPENSSLLPCDQDFSNMQSTNVISAHNASAPSSIFPFDHDFSMNSLQNLMEFSEGITEQYHCSSPLPQILHCLDDFVDQGRVDDDLLRRTEATCHEFDWEEFDDTLFKHDD